MEIAKAIAASVRSLGLTSQPKRERAKPQPGETPPRALTRAEVRVQRANLRLLSSARSTLVRTIALLK